MNINDSVKVGWFPYTTSSVHGPADLSLFNDWQNLAVYPPEPALKSIKEDSRDDSMIMLCPAFTGYLKNTFLIRAPIDFTLSIDSNRRAVSGDRFDQRFFDEWINHRPNDFINPSRPLITTGPKFVFVADEDILIETLPAIMHNTEFIQNTNIIPGTYNIHRWIRPLDITFEVLDTTKLIKFKRGDPLMYIRLIDPKGRKIELERIEQTADLTKMIIGMTSLKTFVPKMKLEKLYDMAHDWLKNRKWLPTKPKKCPFKWK